MLVEQPFHTAIFVCKQQIPGTDEEGEEREDRQTRSKEGEDIVRPELTGRHLRLHLYPAAAPGKLSVSLLFCLCILIH